MTLFKHITKPTLLIPFEPLYIHSYYYHKQLIPEQHIGERIPLYQMIRDIHSKSLPTGPRPDP